MNRPKIWKRLAYYIAVVLLLSQFSSTCTAQPKQELSGIKEGWSWPVVVIPPQSGWESEQGKAIKFAMRAAERELSREREGISGKEVTFMFASPLKKQDIKARFAQWRQMGVFSIVSFAHESLEIELHKNASAQGPSVVFHSGRELRLLDSKGGANPYIFALDLPYFDRANALGLRAVSKKITNVSIYSDIHSTRIARGAKITDALLKQKNVNSTLFWVPGYQMDQFSIPTGEATSKGTAGHISWLDGMATISLWKKLSPPRTGTQLWYAGNESKILLDLDGLLLVDPDQPLKMDLAGQNKIALRIRDEFNVVIKEKVVAGKAYALARWVMSAYQNSPQPPSKERIAVALSTTTNIPLLGGVIAVDPKTHRPKSREVGFLRVDHRKYVDDGKIVVHSAGVLEGTE